MAWIAWHTTSLTCSENIISLEFFANFLFQDKKLGGLGCNPKKTKKSVVFLFYYTDKINVIISEMTKHKLDL